jgi:hypothetical protein
MILLFAYLEQGEPLLLLLLPPPPLTGTRPPTFVHLQ